MFSKLALAAALAVSLGIPAFSGSASAVTAWQPNGDYNPKYDIPLHREGAARPHMSGINHPAMSCSAARRVVREDGYHNVKSEICGPRSYVFDATRHGRSVVLHVDPRNGHVWQG